MKLRVCPLCHTSLDIHLEVLDKVICPGCERAVSNNYRKEVEKNVPTATV